MTKNGPLQAEISKYWYQSVFLKKIIFKKIDGVGPVDNRASPNQLSHFVKNIYITYDT